MLVYGESRENIEYSKTLVLIILITRKLLEERVYFLIKNS